MNPDKGPYLAKYGTGTSADINAMCATLYPLYPGEGEARATPYLRKAATSVRLRTHHDNDEPVAAKPMPKWPVSHESAAFEAVATKKSLVLSPAEIYAECAHHGEEKAKFGWLKLGLLCVIAGCYVAFGFTLCLLVGGNMPKAWLQDSPGLTSLLFGAFGFPFGFTCIMVCGGELYTSMCAYTAAAWWEGKIGWRDALRLLVVSWVGNWVGIAIFIGLMIEAGNFENKSWYSVWLAEHKTHYSWGRCFVKGLFANWLVAIATWQANAAQDLTGKAVAIWLPISAFAAIGFEHCIANMYLLPMAVYYGADIDARHFVGFNIIPATLGNWVGGAVFTATVYAFIFGTPNKKVMAWWEQRFPAAAAAATSSAAQQPSRQQTPNPEKPGRE